MALTSVYVPPSPDLPPATPRELHVNRGNGDKAFRVTTSGSGMVVLLIMAGVGLFLSIEAWDALSSRGMAFLTTAEWEPDTGQFGIAALLLFTVSIALVAVAVALPLSLTTALFITEVAPVKLRSSLIAMVDLMAAVPSIVYGLWGLEFFTPMATHVARWISRWFGWIPFFGVEGGDAGGALPNLTRYTSSTFIAGIVVALMVMPIQCSIMREVFSQVPPGEREGALALGSTRWGMIRIVALPFARGGIIGGTMLGLGRALGETIAIYLIISPRFDLSFNILENGSNSVSAHIALRVGEASGFGLSALMAAGLALFAVTLVVNFSASAVVAKSRSGADSEA